jgi:VWFA-related protein
MKNFLKNTMFGVGVSVLVLILPMVSFLHSQQEHEKIVEEVSVNWWQVPVFAVDKSGNPVTDLEPKDIQVQLNGQQIPAFTLYKRSFTVTEQGKEKEGDLPAARQLPIQKSKVLFLLFDQALSSETSIRQAKKIAEKIIMDAEKDTRFFVMTIDFFTGLKYIGESSGDNKNQLIDMIKKRVKKKKNPRYVDISEIIAVPLGAYERDDFKLFKESASRWNQRKSMGFFYAFETLYFFLNSIQDNKFIYLFSEGMSRNILQTSQLSRGKYYYSFKNAARSLSRGGAVIFIINPTEMLRYSTVTSALSGKDSLNLLAQESGGTYLEGTNEKILEQLENMHRAYYEISFPDLPQLKGPTRKISIKSKRKGIKIHSLRTLEKRKQYDQMNSLEKEMLVLNLITQPQNTLINRKIHAYNARVDKTKKTKKNMIYTVTLPPGYLQQHIDLYKVWLLVNDQGMARLEKMEKESLYPSKNRVKIQFQFPGSQKQKEKDKEIPGETRAYFVLVNGGTEPARVSVHGIELYQEDPQLLELEKKRTAAKAKKSQQIISAEDMNHILQGAADYCQRLKQSAFHFYCREKIVETRMPLSRIAKTKIQIKSYSFGYRLIKQGNQITEERDWI